MSAPTPPTGPDPVARGGSGPPAVEFDAPVVAVVVYPDRARVTRRGRLYLPARDLPARELPARDLPARGEAAGEPVRHEVVLSGLPRELAADSVRVTGHGAIQIIGVDVVEQQQAKAGEAAVADLEATRRSLRRRLAELADADDTETARRAFLDVVARTGAAALARSLPHEAASGNDTGGDGGGSEAGGTPVAARIGALADTLTREISGVHDRRRGIAETREVVESRLAAVERTIANRQRQQQPDRQSIVVTVEHSPAGLPGGSVVSGAAGGTEAEPADVGLEISYLVGSAGWTSVYDARLVGTTVTLTWFAMVSQRTGEDWPACELVLSTARPAGAATLPELSPWYLDESRPVYPMQVGRSMAGAGGYSPESTIPPVPQAAMAAAPVPASPASMAVMARESAAPPRAADTLADMRATGTAAATYRLARPVPVPADGAPHRTTVAVVDLDATLDHVAVPKLTAEAYLRATVTNTSDHTLQPGKVSVFHDQEFVGTSRIDLVPPGAELELHLGVDDRVSVERELVRRSTGKRAVGNLRRTDVTYKITIANHTQRDARVTVKDQVPVSCHEAIAIRDEQAAPTPNESSELGELTWTIKLAPGGTREIEFSFRLEHPRDLHVAGWGE